MKFLPATKTDAIRLACFVVVLVGLALFSRIDRPIRYELSDKQEGDILLQSLPNGELTKAIEEVSQSELSHCGILLKRDGKWVVAEAIGEVRYTPLALWIARGRHFRVESYRVPNLSASDKEKLHAGVEKLIGIPYDFQYAPDDSAIYCSELVYKVYDRELGISTGTWDKLSALNWQSHEAFIRSLDQGRLPLDRDIITPVALTRSSSVKRVFP